ncbi:hypothetical protein cyc_03756 [Cyclospora cayetanensis]|uniref:Uncharacterized protein n=1 Tax=Cyclospora cayetanensis TaxID=88456 RepID=A0A1D3CYV5_9EIME|nr:hypothetical protein cyc_03756 [Cyclospora cayetanensis]
MVQHLETANVAVRLRAASSMSSSSSSKLRRGRVQRRFLEEAIQGALLLDGQEREARLQQEREQLCCWTGGSRRLARRCAAEEGTRRQACSKGLQDWQKREK